MTVVAVQTVQSTHPSPESSSSFLSKWTYSWITPLLTRGARTGLHMEDMYALDSENEASHVSRIFEKAWKSELVRHKDKPITPSMLLFRSLYKAFGKDFVKAGYFLIFQNAMTVGSPVVLLFLITWINQYQTGTATSSLALPFGLAVVLFVTQNFATLFTNWHYELAQRTGFRFRTALTMALYKKSLKLSSSARREHSVGKILNIAVTGTQILTRYQSHGFIMSVFSHVVGCATSCHCNDRASYLDSWTFRYVRFNYQHSLVSR